MPACWASAAWPPCGRTLVQLEQMPPRPIGADFGLDQITVAVGPGEYVGFRLPALLSDVAIPALHAGWRLPASAQPARHPV